MERHSNIWSIPSQASKEEGVTTRGEYMVTSPIRIAKKALLGTLFGDSSLTIHRGLVNDATKAVLTLVHGQDQFQYLLWKMHLLYPLVGSFHIKMLPSKADGKCIIHAVTTYQHYLWHMFNDYYNKVIVEDQDNAGVNKIKFQKVVRMNVLRRLTPLSFALWYMDDGSIYKDSKCSRLKGIRLATYGFDIDENIAIQTHLVDCWKIDATVDVRQDGYTYIRLSKGGAEKFLELVSPFIHPVMLYKTMMTSQSAKHMSRDSYEEIVCALQQCGELVRNNQSDMKSKHNMDWSALVKGPIASAAMRLHVA